MATEPGTIGTGMTAGEARRLMAEFPIADLRIILTGRDPLILAPHPDDESLGCGGLLALCAASGMRPAVLIVTDGTGSHPQSRRFPPEKLRELREAEAREAAQALGVASDRLAFMRLPDTAAPVSGAAFERAVGAIIAQATQWQIGAVLSPWRHDPHCDHVAVHRMAAEICRRTDLMQLAYPVWGLALPEATSLPGEAPSGFRLDVSAALPAKRRAIAAHRSQYAGLIDDDPDGFQLAPEFLARFTDRYEVFLTTPVEQSAEEESCAE